MDPTTKKYRVLETLGDATGELESTAVADRLDSKANVVSATLSTLRDEGYVETTGQGGPQDPFLYSLTNEGRAVVQDDADESDEATDEGEETGLAALFEGVEEGEGGTNGGPPEEDPLTHTEVENADDAREQAEAAVERNVVEEEGLQITVAGPAERVERVENLLSATGDGGEIQAKIALPVADRSADLDHARVLSKLGKSSLIRPYLRALLGLPGEDAPDMTASEQRADEEENVEVVEKAEQ